MQVVSWNVNSIRSRAELVERLLTEEAPDVLTVQETKCTDTRFPTSVFERAGYEVAHLGTGGYNGVAIASRSGLERVQYGFSGEHGPPFDEPRLLAADCGDLRLVTVYVPNGRRVRTAAWEFKLAWLELLRIELGLELESEASMLVVGDFNVCPAPIDLYDATKRDRNLVSEPERSAIARLLDLGFTDLARHLHPPEPGFTWFSFNPGQLETGRGYRLDLALATEAITARAVECRPGLAWRRPELGPSDHAPLMIRLGDG